MFLTSASGPDLKCQAFPETLGVSTLRSQAHGYMANAGFEKQERRWQYSQLSGGKCFRQSIIMTSGACGALYMALRLFSTWCYVARAPCFMEYKFYADNHGGLFRDGSSATDLDLDIQALEKAIDEKTAALIINSPNNPSGKVYPEQKIREMCQMLEKKSIQTGRTVYLLSDEPYRKIVYDGVEVPSVFRYYRNSFIATSYSKDLSVPGERIGWLAVNPEADDFENIINGAVMCNRLIGYVNETSLMQRIV